MQAGTEARRFLISATDQPLSYYKRIADAWSAFMEEGDAALNKARHRTYAKKIRSFVAEIRAHYGKESWHIAEIVVHRELTEALFEEQTAYLKKQGLKAN